MRPLANLQLLIIFVAQAAASCRGRREINSRARRI
jgi:hypothetical protein